MRYLWFWLVNLCFDCRLLCMCDFCLFIFMWHFNFWVCGVLKFCLRCLDWYNMTLRICLNWYFVVVLDGCFVVGLLLLFDLLIVLHYFRFDVLGFVFCVCFEFCWVCGFVICWLWVRYFWLCFGDVVLIVFTVVFVWGFTSCNSCYFGCLLTLVCGFSVYCWLMFCIIAYSVFLCFTSRFIGVFYVWCILILRVWLDVAC